jgi:serine/threonine-protein kinase
MIGSVLRVRYELTKLLGESTFFIYYSAYDKVQARDVSIRIVKDPYGEDAELLATLEELVKRVSSVRHSGIEELYEVDSDGNAVFVVGQLTPGASVADRLKKLTTFSVPATIEVGIAICEALQALHRSGIADGDITAGSVAMQADGEVRLQNVGLWPAFFASQQGREEFLTEAAPYCAPEVSKGGLPNPSSDIYSLGILMFELLTGRRPYVGDNALALALKHATDPVPSVRDTAPSLPQPLDHIIAKAMAKAPASRYADGGEMLSDLRMLQDALRFGKSLTWPPKPEQTKAEVAQPAAPVKVATAVATPKSAVPTKPRPEKKPKTEPERDYPTWLIWIFRFGAGIFFLVVAVIMYSSTSRPASLKIPNLKNLSVDDARQRLETLGLQLMVAKKKMVDGPADIVLSSDPEAGDDIFKGEQVRVTVSAGSRYVEVPDLRGLTPDKARENLQGLGLDLDDRMDQVPDKDLEKGLIVSQAQAPRGKYERGTKIRVNISAGRSRNTETVDLNASRKYVYTLNVKLTKLNQAVRLKVDMTDARGTKTIIDAMHNPDDSVPIKAEGYGSQVTFRIFYDGALVKQMPVNADEAKQTDDSSDSTDNP